jgi:hypothetical protein
VVVDLSMGLLGDVRAAQVPVIEVDNTQFSLVAGAGIRVPSIAAVMADGSVRGISLVCTHRKHRTPS